MTQHEGQAQKQNFRDWLNHICARVQNKEKLKTQNQTLGFGLDEESKRPITVKILHEHIV
jgi:hypothetical protein